MTLTLLEQISRRHKDILSELVAAKDPPPRLVAVSKGQEDDRIEAVLACGQRVFGENRVQEAQKRWAPRREAMAGLELHLIGPLQTNKVRDAVALFDTIQTLDRPKLARALAEEFARSGRRPGLLIQVNTGDEPQKAGVSVAELGSLLRLSREECGLEISGLMCIPPATGPAGPHFALLAKYAREHGLPEISMGMSADYVLAAQFGATLVRVGSALFGEREG
jgi:pyridoxal phosphate enzyme (YggS family)